MYFLLPLYDHDDLLGFPNPINLSDKTSWKVKLVKPYQHVPIGIVGCSVTPEVCPYTIYIGKKRLVG